jgi:hypothetical protein
MIAAVNGIDDDALLNRGFAGIVGADRTLCEGFIASDEDDFISLAVVIPRKLIQSLPNHGSAVFVSAIGGEFEELL